MRRILLSLGYGITIFFCVVRIYAQTTGDTLGNSQVSPVANLTQASTAIINNNSQMLQNSINSILGQLPAIQSTITTINGYFTNGILNLSSLPTEYVKVSDTEAQNTNGGTSTSGSWITRVLNTTDSDTNSISSLASNQITLPAGTYIVRAKAPFYSCGSAQIRIYNVTTSTSLLIGQNTYSLADGVISSVSGLITLSSSSALAVQYQVSTGTASNGLGVKGNFGSEVYTVAEFIKIK